MRPTPTTTTPASPRRTAPPGPAHHGTHAGHDTEQFRRRFWWSLLLTIPVVATSHMVMDWFGYELDFPGIEWVGPVLGSVIFLWGGWPFLEGGRREIKDRQPGMMLLIAMAITVAYVGLDGHVARMVRPRLLVGARRPRHDHAAGPLAGDEGPRPGPGRPRRARRAAAGRGRAGPTRRHRRVGRRSTTCGVGRRGAGPRRRPGARGRRDRRRLRRARRVDDHRRVQARRQGPSATASSPGPSRPTRPSASASTRSGTRPRSPGSSASWPRPNRSPIPRPGPR